MTASVRDRGSVLEYLPERTEALLDVGCNVGALLGHARQLGVPRLYGIEINADAVAAARQNVGNLANVEISQGSADTLPFPSESMDAVTCSEVLEHVPAELRANVLREIQRVLKPGKPLLLTVPHRGLFAPLDPANTRYLVPRWFAVCSGLLGGTSRDEGFRNQKHGVVWHHHFSMAELRTLLGTGFEIRYVRYRGCIAVPLLEWMLFPLYRWKMWDHWLFRAVKRIQRFEMSLTFGERLGYGVLLIAEKTV